MHKRWFESNERFAAKRAAKQRRASAWKYTQKTRAGTKKGFYVGAQIPKVLGTKNTSIEQVRL
jgi:hypothetical protein